MYKAYLLYIHVFIYIYFSCTHTHTHTHTRAHTGTNFFWMHSTHTNAVHFLFFSWMSAHARTICILMYNYIYIYKLVCFHGSHEFASMCPIVCMLNRNVSYHIHTHQTQIRRWNLHGSFFPSGFVAFQSVNIMCGQRGFMAHSSIFMHFLDVFLWEAPVERFAP